LWYSGISINKVKENKMKAFPSEYPSIYEDMPCITRESGMDLRDYFAAKAMQAIMTNSKTFFTQIAQASDEKKADADFVMAQLCYVYADAMMKARAE